MTSVWIVICDYGNSQLAEIDIDSVWDNPAEAVKRQGKIQDAKNCWVECRQLGEIRVAYH